MNRSILSISKLICVVTIFVALRSADVYAQVPLPVSNNFKSAYKNGTRNISGLPGKNYWQNRADYKINVTFNPATKTVTGTVDIRYQNNSTDTLKKVVFKLYPNLYQQQSMRNMPVAPEDLTNGVDVSGININDTPLENKNLSIRGTNMYVKGVEILPAQITKFNLKFAYNLNKGSFIRTGEVDTGAFVIAYFFPRIAVYDDVDGWNDYPYLGKEEFYNDFCNFKVDISLPGNYQCWATGNLVNADAVYNPKFVKLIEKALHTDSIVNIISAKDIEQGSITQSNPVNVWKFEADNVTDFTFAVSNHYVWQSSGVLVDQKNRRRTRVDAVYNPGHKAYFPVIGYARKAVALMSNKLPAVPFPYPHETIFEGLDAMEYPMMVNNLPFEDKDQAIELTVHEIFHSLFPFYVGTNETKYSFMDEGWATLSEFTLSAEIDPGIKKGYDISDVNASAVSDQDVPIMTLTPQLYGKARYADKDLKPALGFYYIKEMLGEKVFLKALQFYIDQWKGKHPTPFDFFYCFNKGSGKNMNWFWKNWYFEKNIPDLGIKNVSHNHQLYTIVIANKGSAAVPIHLKLYFIDGSAQLKSSSILCWEKGNKYIAIRIRAKKSITKIVLGEQFDADVNPQDNVWISKS